MWRQLLLTVVVGTALAVVGLGADALAGRVDPASATERDNVTRAAEMLGLSEAQVRDLREQGITWPLLRKATDIVAAEGVSFDEALERIRNDVAVRAEGEPSEDGRATGERSRSNRDRGEQPDRAERIAEATGFPASVIREFQLATGLPWPEVQRIASVAFREGLTLAEAADRSGRSSG